MYKPVVVALRRAPQIPLEEQLEQVMTPFLHDPRHPEEESRCDGWWIGGYWAGHFLSRHRTASELVKPLGFPPHSPLGGYTACDGGPKGLLDLDRLRCTAEEAVWRRWPRRFAELFGTHRYGENRLAAPSDEDVGRFSGTTTDLLAQARGRAVVMEGLVTLEGEWVDPEGGWFESLAAYSRADSYIDSLDDDAWLVCLTVHF
ncbi:hypothetical protein [Nocardiopsis tropica]|uniref:Uncharacterized protein n=1 Tax=Nocardiopsis tropica TaxID=109330 RepID=A0ABU7KHX9_9ACTN|nr:hypothetical protein [Nocardiopsis umidischolae]MEE2048900.1 hypothetical protein [Nocardiopsis umidischolae]